MLDRLRFTAGLTVGIGFAAAATAGVALADATRAARRRIR